MLPCGNIKVCSHQYFQHELHVLIKGINKSIILFSFFKFSLNYLHFLNYSKSLWMARLCLLGERGACLCSLLRLPLSLLYIIETGVECCSGVGVWLLLSSSFTSSSSSTECLPPVARLMMSVKAQATLCLGICLSDGAHHNSRDTRPQVLLLAIVYTLLEPFHQYTCPF